MTYKKFLDLMREPDDLRKLRNQAERIRHNRALANRRLRDSFLKDQFRQEIRKAGEQPCC